MKKRSDASAAAATAMKHRRIQREQDDKDRSKTEAASKSRDAAAGQAGVREHPVRLPAQHLTKPGNESDLELQPRFLASDYQGSGKLENRVALVTGGDSGIGRAVAILFAREGADVGIVYLNEHADAARTKQHVQAEGRRCVTIAGDVKDSAFCRRAVEKVVQELGSLDVLVNNAAFQEHVDSLETSTTSASMNAAHQCVRLFYMARAVLPHLGRRSSPPVRGRPGGASARLLDQQGRHPRIPKALAQNLVSKGILATRRTGPGGRRQPGGSPHRQAAEFEGTDSAAQPKNCRWPCFWPRPCSSYIGHRASGNRQRRCDLKTCAGAPGVSLRSAQSLLPGGSSGRLTRAVDWLAAQVPWVTSATEVSLFGVLQFVLLVAPCFTRQADQPLATSR